MGKNLLYFLVFFVCFYANQLFAQCTTNFLKNPSFELPAQPSQGNNFPVTVTDWTIVGGGGSNLIKVNGVTDYYGGPNSASNGNQYLDIVSASGTAEQTFTTTCNSVITFRGDFSSREIGRNWTAKIEIVNSANVVVATSSIRNFTTADADNALPPGPDAVWYTVSGTSATIPAGTYKFKAYIDDYGNFDNAFMCVTPGCVLPVKLKDFSIADNNCKPLLSWNTTQEVNCKQYEIEMSTDGIAFSKIAIIAAKNDFNLNNYTYLHDNLIAKNAYYRLKIIDADGQFKYSSILRFVKKCDVNYLFTAYPNPVKDKININYFDANLLEAEVNILSVDGKLLMTNKLKNGTTVLDASKLSSGVYYISVMNGLHKQSQKLIKK